MTTTIKAAAKGLFRPILDGLNFIKEAYKDLGVIVYNDDGEISKNATVARALGYLPMIFNPASIASYIEDDKEIKVLNEKVLNEKVNRFDNTKNPNTVAALKLTRDIIVFGGSGWILLPFDITVSGLKEGISLLKEGYSCVSDLLNTNGKFSQNPDDAKGNVENNNIVVKENQKKEYQKDKSDNDDESEEEYDADESKTDNDPQAQGVNNQGGSFVDENVIL